MPVYNAKAKINLYLHVTGRRGDGYHDLDSLIAFTDIGDKVTVTQAARFSVSLSGPFAYLLAPASDIDNDNIICKTVKALCKAADKEPQFSIALEKNIPVGSGLGGGSADAAAVAGALLAHWKMDKDDIIGFDRIMLGLGADVPVCLRDKATIVRGKGEDLSDLPSELPPVYALLVYPGAPCSTADVFKRHNGKAGKSYDLAAWPRRGVFLNALRECRNDLTDAASAMTPEINTAMKELSQYDDCKIVRMSGSGSTCFALFTDQKKMIDIAHKIRTQYPQWWIQTTGLH